jgi:hypothetical protein
MLPKISPSPLIMTLSPTLEILELNRSVIVDHSEPAAQAKKRVVVLWMPDSSGNPATLMRDANPLRTSERRRIARRVAGPH